MSRAGRRAVVPAVALAAALLAAGCSAFPQEGPVVEGPRVDAVGAAVPAFAQPPALGATPQEIVGGFLSAGEDVQGDHRVAREYLASSDLPWDPSDGATMLAGAPQITLVTGLGSSPAARQRSQVRPEPGTTASVRVRGTVLARVDGSGLMRLPTDPGTDAQGEALDVAYQLVADKAGQWRIEGTPAEARGLVLTYDQFVSTFRVVSLYFVDPTGRWLVPDLRWFPELDPTPTPTATLVVKALLAGAAPWLGQIGETAGARLTAVPGVQIDGDVAHVDLDHSVYDATKQKPERRRVLVAELQATLQNLVGTSQVVLTSDQAKLEVPDGPVPMLWSTPAAPASSQLGRADAAGRARQDELGSSSEQPPLCLTTKGRVGELDQTQAARMCRERTDWAALPGPDLHLPTSDAAGSMVAAVVRGGTAIVAASSSGTVRQVLSGTGLNGPSIDPEGWVWSTTSDGKVLAGRLGSRQRTIGASWLSGERVTTVRVSREGARALLLLTHATAGGRHTRAVVAGIVRDASGAPSGFAAASPLAVVGDLTRAVDAGWADDQNVVVLGSMGADKNLYVLRGQVGGPAGAPFVTRKVPGNAIGLAVRDVEIYVRLANGTTAASVLGDWKPLGTVRELTLPN